MGASRITCCLPSGLSQVLCGVGDRTIAIAADKMWGKGNILGSLIMSKTQSLEKLRTSEIWDKPHPPLKLLIHFGSRARGDHGPSSDAV